MIIHVTMQSLRPQAEELPLSKETSEIRDCLARYGAVKANKLTQQHDELREIIIKSGKTLTTSSNGPIPDIVIVASSNETLASYPISSCISQL